MKISVADIIKIIDNFAFLWLIQIQANVKNFTFINFPKK